MKKAQETGLADLEGATLPQGRGLSQARGFQGLIRNGITIVQPTNTPRGAERTPPETAAHRALSSLSIRIEHAMGGVKRERMVKDKLRLLKDGLRDMIMETCGGRHNFRLQYRPWPYANS
jgi:hypothetical protein